MSSFRVELVLMQAVLSQHETERLNDQEALKADLRIVVSLYTRQFLEIEASIAAAAATSSPTTQPRLSPQPVAPGAYSTDARSAVPFGR